MNHISIRDTDLKLDDCYQFIAAPDAGGIDIFVGTVRNKSLGKTAVKLEFEAYEKMAISEIAKIIEEARSNWDLINVFVAHRTGTVEVMGIAVIIGVSSMHRAAAFEACRFIIDNLKQTVPIWKKEFFDDGAHWVSAHP